METSKAMKSNSLKKGTIFKYTYIFLAGFFVFINCYLGAIGFISEESSKIDYSRFLPFTIWGIGFFIHIFKQLRFVGLIILSLPFIYWLSLWGRIIF
jgi:hypothetical protein